MPTEDGKKAIELYYNEVMAEMERAEPGCTSVLV
jgi:hypothetical protein